MLYLLELVGYHGKGLENSICWPGDGDYSFRAVPLWNVNTGTTLYGQKEKRKFTIMCQKQHNNNRLLTEKLYLHLRAFSSLFLLSGNEKREQYWDAVCNSYRHHNALHGLLVVFVINTFPMMLPTSCRKTKPLLAVSLPQGVLEIIFFPFDT